MRMQRETRDKELRLATQPPSWHLFNKTAQHIDAQLSAHLAHRHYAKVRLEASERQRQMDHETLLSITETAEAHRQLAGETRSRIEEVLGRVEEALAEETHQRSRATAKHEVASVLRTHRGIENEKVRVLGELGGWMLDKNTTRTTVPPPSQVMKDIARSQGQDDRDDGSGDATAESAAAVEAERAEALRTAKFIKLATTGTPATISAAVEASIADSSKPLASASTAAKMDEARVRDVENQMSQDVLAASLRSIRTRKSLRRLLSMITHSASHWPTRS